MSHSVCVHDGFDDYVRVGQGGVTSGTCQKVRSLRGCLNPEHGIVFDKKGNLIDARGKAEIDRVVMSCDKPSCSACYRFGWAVREGKKIDARLAEGSKLYGNVEHVVVSPSHSDCMSVAEGRLSVESLRRKAVDAARARGAQGGVVVYHQERFNRWRGWYRSPHFHILGFLGVKYRCRYCDKYPFKSMAVCGGCSGFEGLTRRLNIHDGYIVKVAEDEEGFAGERKSVFATAVYELRHASFRVVAKRSHVATWFGVASYRRLKVVPVRKPHVCSICGAEKKPVEYLGSNPEVRALLFNMVDGKRSVLVDLCEGGRPNFEYVPEREAKFRRGVPF